MCLGIPGQVIAVDKIENWAVVESFGVQKKVSILLIDEEVIPGEYLMVHAGCAIGKINDADYAQETLKLLEEVYFD
ncbi:MAG TPA: HypC/HybG/HupF family hydrogenase formation chaperone [Desulfotomaculum sp.]|nr:MAG: Hydrogenase maturation factor [Desulfotomaculum sp. 46_80]HAG10085.1 HypC/HybG/HupF family hydrogenase formation chaperone [Desulfotomaculum sp.]HBY04113.1 HypC/HybG/HupF family hydrogenase formation chaperone [Desulfotomaculum sp.]